MKNFIDRHIGLILLVLFVLLGLYAHGAFSEKPYTAMWLDVPCESDSEEVPIEIVLACKHYGQKRWAGGVYLKVPCYSDHEPTPSVIEKACEKYGR